MPRSFVRPAGAIPAVLALALNACSKGVLIGSGPLPTPPPVVPNVSAEFTVPTANSSPNVITVGADGFLYFAETAGNKIGQMTTGGAFQEYPVPTAGSAPFDLIGTSDSNIWFTERTGNKIGELLTAKTFAEYPLPTPNAGPTYIAIGPDGNLWFSETTANKLGRIDLNGNVSEFPVPTANAGLAGLVGSSDGGVYVVETNASQIVRFDTHALTFGAPHPTLTANAGPTQIVLCPDNQTFCFTENNVAKLGQITQGGIVTEHSLSPATSANALIVGGDFNLYFTDSAQNKFGQVSGISFGVKEFSITSSGAQPAFMSLGADVEIYFTENATNKIARLSYF